MSYEICYSRNFIKTSRGIIPLVLSGSNNCHEWTGKSWRRERNWTCYYGNKHIEANANDILMFLKKQDDEYNFCDFKGKTIYYRDACKFYEAGIKNAHTIEDYIKYGRQKGWGGLGCMRCYVSDWRGDKKGEKTLEKNISTTADLEKWLDEARALIGKDDNVYICLKWFSNEPITIKKDATIKGVCCIKKGRWFISARQSNYGTTLTPTREEAMIFENKDEAQRYKSEHDLNYGYNIFNYDVNKKVAPKNCYIEIKDYGYFCNFTRYGFRYTYSLCSYNKMTRQRAKKVLARLENRHASKEFKLIEEGI